MYYVILHRRNIYLQFQFFFFQGEGKMCKIETLRFLLFSEPMVLNKVTLWEDFPMKTLKCVF